MPSAEVLYFCSVAAGPIVLGLVLVGVLLRQAAARPNGHSADARAPDAGDVAPRIEARAQRRELAVQLAIGFGLAVVGGVAGWAYLATTVHRG